jgi:D-alanyl-D-alanine endopeptidase (penicillin-binding protein 7)
MTTTTRKSKLRLAALVAALLAAGALVPLAYHRNAAPPRTDVASAPATAPAAPGANPTPEEQPVPAAPPGAEVVPPEESETDHGPAAASPAGPTMSFGRAAGLQDSPDPLRLSASAALLVDQDSGQVLVHKNDQAVLPIASLTKLMTTLLVLEAKQPMDEVLTITQDDVDTERHSRSRLKPGTTLTREEALHLALMSSENRAAHALGRNYPGGLPKLVEAMNAKAKQLGMNNTTYVDPTGLSNRNQSTAHDLAQLLRQAQQNPVMREFSTTPAHLANLGGRTLQYINSNRLVRNQRAGWDIVLQKTGYIVEAGRCMTMVLKEGSHNLLLVLLDSGSNGTRITDAERMRRYAVAQLGIPDTAVAQARPQRAPAHQQASARKAPADGKRHSAVARQGSEGNRKKPAHTAVAHKAEAKSTQKRVAGTKEKPDHGETHAKSGRVRQTFASTHPQQKS